MAAHTPCPSVLRSRTSPGWLLFLWLIAAPASAATYYVRSDGGDARQCDGQTDAPHQGGSRACAWKHPFIALPPHGKPRIDGGDTLVIARGSYRMGLGAPGSENCDDEDGYTCVMAPPPSGPSPDRPTRLLGQGIGGACKTPPELWATQGAQAVLRLDDVDNVEVACLDLTDHSACILDHNRDGNARGETSRCPETPPYGDWGENGIHAADARTIVLRDVNVHGFAGNGVRAGRLRDWTLTRLTLRANGWAGWDGNLDEGEGTSSSNSGYLRFSGGEIAWNGCGERYPGKQVFGCWAQQQGGYGDGLGTAESGGQWTFEDVHVHHNTSDGLDLLYMDGSGSVTVRRVRSEGNAGNQIKVSGPVLIENSIAVGNCAFFESFPTSNLGDDDHCRAKGNALSIRPTHGSVPTIRYNTVAGQGDCLMITTQGDASARVLVQNNAFIGGPEWRQSLLGGQLTCGHFAVDSEAPVTFQRNLFWQVKDDFCPAGNVCQHEPRVAQTKLARFDATPLPGSPLIDAGEALPQTSQDYFGRPRPVGTAPDIGAVEYRAATSSTPAR